MAKDISFYNFTIRGKTYNEPHTGQKKVLQSNARYKVVCCGRRWGKTVMAVNTLLEHAFANSNHTYWYIGPTFRQAKTIAWKFLLSRLKMFPKEYQKRIKINETNLSIELTWNGSVVELKGVERPDNLLGVGLDGVVLDEYATPTYGSYPIWEEIIRPALSDRHGWAIFISTPRGYNHFYELFEKADSKTNPDWEAWRMPSKTNPVMTNKELESARRDIGDDLFSQEYEAEFKKRSGLVYPEFSRDIHIIDDDKLMKLISPKWNLEVGVDFGSAHPTAGLFVTFDHIHDNAYVVDEHYQSMWTVSKHAGAMKSIEDKWLAILKRKQPRVRWGDSQGKQIIMEYANEGYFLTPTLKGKDSVDQGINAVRRRLNNDIITNKPKLYVARHCVNTIREFENYVWTGMDDAAIETNEMMRLANKRKDAPRKIFDDAMDALRYVIQYHSPMGETGIRRERRKPVNPITGI